MHRFFGRLIAAIALSLAAVGGSHAQTQSADQRIDTASAPAIGGLSLVPERWRYQPSRAAVAVTTDTVDAPAASRRAAPTLRSLDSDYVADRASFINTLRARRGLALLTLWEGAERCLFFGINERGRAGISFVRMRSLRENVAAENPMYLRYAQLTGEVRPTFPEPPRLFPH